MQLSSNTSVPSADIGLVLHEWFRSGDGSLELNIATANATVGLT
jgi:hypothetical protein